MNASTVRVALVMVICRQRMSSARRARCFSRCCEFASGDARAAYNPRQRCAVWVWCCAAEAFFPLAGFHHRATSSARSASQVAHKPDHWKGQLRNVDAQEKSRTLRING